MSWLFSRALVEEYLADTCSDGAPFVPSSGSPTPQAYLPPDRMTAFSRPSRFGMTFAPLTADRGEALLTLYLAAFRAKPIPRRLRERTLRMISGRKCGGSWQMSLPGTYLPKMLADERSIGRQTTLSQWVTLSDAWKYRRQTWALTTYGAGIGYLHTPTTIANFCAPSMQKHPSCRAWRKVFGAVSPSAFEYLMGWPLGWTDLKPLATDKSHSALQQRGDC